MSAPLPDEVVVRLLGEAYRGRRYLRFGELVTIGIAKTRPGLMKWCELGKFPRPIRIASRDGTTLLWLADEVAAHLAACVANRKTSTTPSEMETGTPGQGAPVMIPTDPLATGAETPNPEDA